MGVENADYLKMHNDEQKPYQNQAKNLKLNYNKYIFLAHINVHT